MKGTILSIIFGAVVFISLNHKVFDNFFKIKRQRIYKPNSLESESETSTQKVSNIKNVKVKRRLKNQPPTK